MRDLNCIQRIENIDLDDHCFSITVNNACKLWAVYCQSTS